MTTCNYCPMPNGEHHRGCCELSPLRHPPKPKSTSYHIVLAVDADRFTDAYIRKNILSCVTHEGRTVTVKEFRAMCAEARAKGLEVFPSGDCDNYDEKGSCKGHPEEGP